MNIQQLKYLAKVAETRSISQAAQALYLSQSSISKSLKSLEEELGFQLFQRNRGGVTFTAEGQRFLQDVYPLLDRYARLENRYLAEKDKRMHFAVSSQHYRFALAAFQTLLNENRGREYTMELLERRTQQILTDVTSMRSNLGIVYLSRPNKADMLHAIAADGLEFRPFCTAFPHVFLSKNHPLASEKTLSLKQLQDYPHIQYSYETDRPVYSEEYAAPDDSPRQIFTTDRHSLINIIKETDAWTTGSGYMTGPAADDIADIPLKKGEREPMLIGWVCLPDPGPSDTALHFIDLCRRVLRRKDNRWLTLREDPVVIDEI